ncbi:MAG: hypothetical protein MJ066_04745 [Clostridia bacterium]|nr:hypothetical protein [Clostridia bacterium]
MNYNSYLDETSIKEGEEWLLSEEGTCKNGVFNGEMILTTCARLDGKIVKESWKFKYLNGYIQQLSSEEEDVSFGRKVAVKVDNEDEFMWGSDTIIKEVRTLPGFGLSEG